MPSASSSAFSRTRVSASLSGFGVAEAEDGTFAFWAATATSSCAGTSKKDAQTDAWLSVPKGACEKIVGGSLAAKK